MYFFLSFKETKQAFDEAEFELLIPGKLKSILLDDYDRLKRRGMVYHTNQLVKCHCLHLVLFQVVVLPARHSITEILDDFVRDLEEDQVTLQTLPLVETMRNNFRDRLEDQLLYDGFERKQFQQVSLHKIVNLKSTVYKLIFYCCLIACSTYY